MEGVDTPVLLPEQGRNVTVTELFTYFQLMAVTPGKAPHGLSYYSLHSRRDSH